MITLVAGRSKGSGRRCWINSPTGNVADKAGYPRRQQAVSTVGRLRRQPKPVLDNMDQRISRLEETDAR